MDTIKVKFTSRQSLVNFIKSENITEKEIIENSFEENSLVLPIYLTVNANESNYVSWVEKSSARFDNSKIKIDKEIYSPLSIFNRNCNIITI